MMCVRASYTVELAKSREGMIDGKLRVSDGSRIVHVIVNLVQIFHYINGSVNMRL
jgi:hypothetical protein